MKRSLSVYAAFGPMFHASRLLGVLPLTRARRSHGCTSYKPSALARAYSFSLLSASVAVVIYLWEDSIRLFYDLVRDGKDSHKRMLVNKVEYACSVVSSVGNLMFSMTCGRRLARTFRTLSKVDATLEFPVVALSRDMGTRQRAMWRTAAVQSSSFLASWVLALTVDILSYGKGNLGYWRLAPFYFLRLVTLCVEQQFIQVALILRERFSAINDALENVSPPAGLKKPSEKVARVRIRAWPKAFAVCAAAELVERLRDAHGTLCAEVDGVSKVYQLPLLTDMFMMFFDFIAGGYFFITDLLGEGELRSLASSCSWLLNSSLRIALLSWAAWRTSSEARMAGQLTVRLMGRQLDEEAKEELNIFMMQLSQQEARFSIMGLFYLDMTVLQALTQAATSYLLVLVQFQS